MNSEQKEMWRCSKCHVQVHKECAELFGQSQKSTPKKTKYENRVYGKIREFPQVKDPQYSEGLNVWICEGCEHDDPKKISCHFCRLFDGSMARIKFQNEKEKSNKRKHPEDEPEPKKWAHMNCILKLYNERPHIDYDRNVILENDALADAPLCKTCEGKYKLDVKCTTCGDFYAHNLCLNNEKTNVKLCEKCCNSETAASPKVNPTPKSSWKQYTISERISTQPTATYMSRLFRDILRSNKYKDFCDTTQNGEHDENENSEIEEEEDQEGDEEEDDQNELDEPEEKSRIKNHYFGANEEGEFVYSFPFAQRLLFSSETESTARDQVNAENGKENKQREKTEMIEEVEDESVSTKIDSKNISDSIMSFKHKTSKERFDKNLNELVTSVKKLYYISSYQLLKGLIKIYTHSCSDKDTFAKIKLTIKWYQLLSDLNRKDENWLQTYDEKMRKVVCDEFAHLAPFRVPATNWPSIPKFYRKYVPLEGFVMSSEREGFKKEIERVISTKKQHKCSYECACSTLSQLGPYLHDKQTWDSACCGRAVSMECDENCGCDLTVCQNRPISGHKRKVLNKDIVEKFCWGIDYATHRAVTIVLPDFENIDKHDFIEKKLLKAVHHTDTPWDMAAVCKQIIKKVREGSKIYTNVDAMVAKMLIQAIKFINTFTEAAFRLHTKGYGVVCMNENGMAPNALVAEYYGELYTPWRWFEKQDLIKKYCKEKKMINNQPDFYNIMLEKHKDDPDGYDILVIDPIHKGNFASRFSHSCDPNCSTISTIAHGKYGIAMYGLKPIGFGEELTFDYFSVTENEKEYRQAICLCGSQNCRIRYLNLITSRNQNSYLDKNQSFLRRNYLIYRSHEPLTKEDYELMDSYSIKSSILENCTNWLKKWIVLILEFIRDEKNQFVNIMLPAKIAEHEAQTREKITLEGKENIIKLLEIERLSLEADRIQNLTITVNKVRHVLDLIREKAKPKQATSRFKKTKDSLEEDFSAQTEETAVPSTNVRMSTRSSRSTGPRKSFAEFNEEVKVSKRVVKTRGSKALEDDEEDETEIQVTTKKTTFKEKKTKRKTEASFELEETTMEQKEVTSNGGIEEESTTIQKTSIKIDNQGQKIEEEREAESLDDVPAPFIRISPLDVSNTLIDCHKLLKHSASIKSNSDFLRVFWNGEGILDKLFEMIDKYSEKKQDLEKKIRTALLDTIETIKTFPQDFELRFYAVRKLCLYLSNIFNKISSQKHIDYQGVSDTLYFYSITFTYFTNYNYPTVASYDPVVVRACDVPNPAKYFSDKGPSIEEDAKILQEVNKSYSASYIWAQLTIWWKQTVEKPEATLSQERRGTVSNPTFEQSFLDTYEKDKQFDYPYGSRENWHRKLVEAPSVSWPIFKNPKRKSMTWSFKNDKRMYGTFLFEGVVQESKCETFVEDVVKVLNKSEEERNKVFCRLNTLYFKNKDYDLPCEMKILTFKNIQTS